jgi:hypothetical protein
VSLNNGSVGAPSLNFSSETTTGIYRAASGEFNVAILGALRLTVSASGIAVVGAGAFTGAVSGTTGTFTSGVAGGTY